MSLLPLCEWLAARTASIALHESLYVYPLVETTHVLSLMLFVGTVSVVDLRLLGFAFREVPVSEVTGRVLPLTAIGFAIAATTGALLFFAIPVRTYLSIFFRIKVIVLLAAGVNAWLFHRYMARGAPWDADARPPARARLAGAVSLCAWAVVIVVGRMIAYDWFDCGSPYQSDFIRWAAGCVAPDPLP